MNLDIKDLLDDNKSGSYTITANTLNLFKKYILIQKKSEIDIDTVFGEVHSAVKILLRHQPNMVLLRKSCNSVVSHFKRILKTSRERCELLDAVEKRIEAILQELESNVENISLNGAKIITNFNKIMTISNSTIVNFVLKKADSQKRKFELYCLKSSPPTEGVLFAENMNKCGIKTTLVPDSQAGIVLSDMNMVLIGADRLYEGGFVNKSGTLALCLLARHYNVPVYLAVETLKILKESEHSIKQTDGDPNEVYNSKNGISVINRYYEKIPLNLVSKVISEEGVFETPEFTSWYLGE